MCHRKDMPGPIHQGLLYLVKRSPHLVFELARKFDEPIPDTYTSFEVAANELPEPSRPGNVVYADWVVAAILEDPRRRSVPKRTHKHVAGLAVEIQTSDDDLKYYTWLSYAAGVRRLFRCRGWTMVFAPDPDIRRQAQSMFVNEPRASPWFVEPEMLPPITQIELALGDLHKAVLTAVFHARSPQAVACARATLEALAQSTLASDDRSIYHSLVVASLKKEQLRQIPQEILDIDRADPLGPMELTGAYYVRGHEEGLEEGREEGREEGLEQGREEGLEAGRRLALQQVLRRVLLRRGLLSDDSTADNAAAHERIESCKAPTLLEQWHDRALTARSLTEVFDPPESQ
jgi:hypothetical protein